MKFGLHGVLILSFLMGLVGCSWERREDDFNGPIRVQIPFAINGKYSLQIVDLLSLTSLEGLQGSAAKFLMDPSVQNGRLNGVSPSIRYIRNSDGVIVPKDDLSLQLLTVYAHIEKLQALDGQVGAAGILRYPRTVAVNAEYRTGEGSLENNALYSGEFDSLLVVPYTVQALPIMANGGILGHEHFHALFYQMVIAPLGKKYPGYKEPTPHSEKRLQLAMGLINGDTTRDEASTMEVRERYHSMVLRGINEGLADVWGWIYSGDSNFVKQSLPDEKSNRSLDVTPEILNSKAMLKDWVERTKSDDNMLGSSYALGNQIARAIKGLAREEFRTEKEMTDAEYRLEIGRLMMSVLPELKAQFAALKDEDYLNPSSIISLFAEKFAATRSSDKCNYLLSLVPESEKIATLTQKCQSPE